MLKNILGNWGSGLDDADYACALAALGALESRGVKQHQPPFNVDDLVPALEEEFSRSERTPIWRNAKNPRVIQDDYPLDLWLETIYDDPLLLADAWRRYCQNNQDTRKRPRLGLESTWRAGSRLFDFDELYDWLRHPAVQLGALVLHDQPAFSHRITWHWPLRVGVPVGEDQQPVLSALRNAQRERAWIKELSDVMSVGAGRDRCDLLVLTEPAVRDILGGPRTHLRASFVVCISEDSTDVSSVMGVHETLGRRLHASGIASVGNLDDSSLLGNWFIGVLRELSHDAPVHSAVYSQRPTDRDSTPVLVGNVCALDQCRLLGLAEQQDRLATELAANQPRRPVPTLGHEPTFGGPGREGKSSPQGSLQERFADTLRSLIFDSESVDGIGTARNLVDRQAELDEFLEPRWIQARAWQDDSLEQTSGVLAPDRWNMVAVHIGPAAGREDEPFPDSRIDFGGNEVPLDVQLEVAGAEIVTLGLRDDVRSEFDSPPGDYRSGLLRELRNLKDSPSDDTDYAGPGLASCGILLPPVGDSTLAMFAVRPQAETKHVDARITVIHGNRVLQIARARIEVTEGTAATADAQLDVTAEETIHPRDDDLEERREYDVAIQVSDIGGKLHLIIQQDGSTTPVQLDDLREPIKAIQNALKNAALKWDYSKPVFTQRAFSDVIYALAAHGTSLKQHLSERWAGDVDSWERIHLVPSTDEFLPLEYVYDGPPPATDASVCPNVVAALKQGGCHLAVSNQDKNEPCPNQSSRSFVCPLRFWGFHRLIERNGVLRDVTERPGDGTQTPEICVPSKQRFGGAHGVVFAASDRTFRYESKPEDQDRERSKLVASLGSLSSQLSDVGNWDDWRDAICHDPNLLVLVAHTDMHRGAPVLEIGDGNLLGRHEILPDVTGTPDQPRLLILLGCSAAGVTEDFQPYPERFRMQGVSIVLAPVASIRGADAVPIAKRLAELLGDRLAGQEPTDFGGLLPSLRRELLSEGHPGVMGILGFGDGDWLIGGQ